MMNVRLGIALLLCISVLSPSLLAQWDDGELYYPPQLTVNASSFGYTTQKSEYGDRFETVTHNGVFVTEWRYPAIAYVLSMIFFDHPADVDIPARYERFVSSYAADNFTDTAAIFGYPGPNPKYYQLLNIIGYRLSIHPKATIVLEGGYSTETGENAETATLRAENVKTYLSTTWRIEPERIRILPSRQHCSDSAHVQLQEESRRVTIASENPEILAPIRYSTVNRSTSYVNLALGLDTKLMPNDVAEIAIEILNQDTLVASTAIEPIPGTSVYSLQGGWYPGELGSRDEAVTYSIRAVVRTFTGDLRSSNVISIPVHFAEMAPYTGDSPYGNGTNYPRSVTIPFFEFRDSTLNWMQLPMIDSLLRTLTYYSADSVDVILTGFCDLSEEPDITEAELQAQLAEYADMRDRSEMEFRGEFRSMLNLYPAQLTSYEEEMRMDRYEEKRIYSEEEYAVADTASYEEYEEWTPPPLDSTVADAQRALRIERLIKSQLGEETSVTVNGNTWHGLLMLPEDRFYGRFVEVWVNSKMSDEYYEEGEGGEEVSANPPRTR